MSYKCEVIADDSGQWCGNALRFATAIEAEWYANDLFSRWTAVREKRVVESESEQMITARVVANRLEMWSDKTRCNKCHVSLAREGNGTCECGGLIEETGWER